jgi:hypothetical protein
MRKSTDVSQPFETLCAWPALDLDQLLSYVHVHFHLYLAEKQMALFLSLFLLNSIRKEGKCSKFISLIPMMRSSGSAVRRATTRASAYSLHLAPSSSAALRTSASQTAASSETERKPVTVALIQFHSESSSPEENQAKAERYVRQAAGQGAQFILLPELYRYETFYII